MNVSVIIPVLNGAAVITQCLDALVAQSCSCELELICVDNASLDDSAALIAERFPQVHLIRLPVNLGFAGGVNAGIEIARGDILVLLNQDCIVNASWLDALSQELWRHPEIGVAGCQILNPDGTLNHLGARIQRSDARGIHCVEMDEHACPIEYVTGATFAIRRDVWNVVGCFDEGFYPAYYEDADYCFRARRRGYEILCVPTARVTHLFSNQAWQVDTIKYAANHHRARYRFVCKHFGLEELSIFFEAESAALQSESYFNHTIGRALAARDTLRSMSDILRRRTADLGEELSAKQQRHLQVGFTTILRHAFTVAIRQSQSQSYSLPAAPALDFPDLDVENSPLAERERVLLTRLAERFPAQEGARGALESLGCLLKRVARTLSGEEHRLLSELYAVQIERMAQADQKDRRWREQFARTLQQYNAWAMQLNSESIYGLQQRLKLLEILVDYDYR